MKNNVVRLNEAQFKNIIKESVKKVLNEIYYDNKEHNLESYIRKKHESWIERGDSEKSWNDEGIVWTVQEYYSSMGAFSDDDWKTLENLGLEEIGEFCEEEYS